MILAAAAYAWLKKTQSDARLAEALRTESLFRAEQANSAWKGGDAMIGTLLALEGLPDTESNDEIRRTRPYVNRAEQAL